MQSQRARQLLVTFAAFPFLTVPGRSQDVVAPTFEVFGSHDAPITALALSGDGKRLFSGSTDGEVRIWNLKTRKVEKSRAHPVKGRILQLAPAPDGKRIAIVEELPLLGGSVHPIEHLGEATGIGLSAGVHILRMKCVSVAWDPKSRFILAGFDGGWVYQHPGREPEGLVVDYLGARIEKDVPLAPLVIDSSGKWLACGTPSGRIQIVMTTTIRKESVLEGHEGPVTALAFHPRSPTLVSGSQDGTVRVWSLPSVHPRQKLEGHSGAVLATAFSSDGKLLATADVRGEIRIWDTTKSESPAFRRSLRSGREGPVNAVAFSNDGRHFFSGGQDQDLLVWGLKKPSGR